MENISYYIQNNPVNKHVEWIEYSKAITMLLVIISHCGYYSMNSIYGGVNYIPEGTVFCIVFHLIYQLVSLLYSFHMPLFMAISGMCYSISSGKNLNYSCFVKKKFYRLMIPFLSVMIFFNLPVKYIYGYYDNSQSVVSDMFFGQFLAMDNGHLWFLLALFWISSIYYLIDRCFGRYPMIILTCLLFVNILTQCDYFGKGIACSTHTLKYLFWYGLGANVFNFIDSKSKTNNMNIGLILIFCGTGLWITTKLLFHDCSEYMILRYSKALLSNLVACCMGGGFWVFQNVLKSIQKRH